MIFLAVLTVGLLGSCTKNIEERLDKTEADVAKIENAIGRYGDLQSDIAAVLDALKKDVGSRPASEQQSVWNCINALQNQRSTFDTAIKALQKLVGEDAVSVQIDAATAELISDYNLDNLASTLQELKEKVNAKYDITAIEKEVEKLKGRMDVISYAMAEMSEIEGMIQSVSIAPAYSDGSIKADEEGLLTFRCIVSPANALSGESDLEECFTLYANSVEVLTKGKKSRTIPILGIQLLDRTQGVYEITADAAKALPKDKKSALTVALNVKTSTSDFITRFVKVTSPDLSPQLDYVEIGGVKWATKNLGAEKVTDYGDYFAWGATVLAYSSLSSNTFTFVASRPTSYGGSGWTQSKGFDYENTPYYNGSTYTKYTSSDSKTVLESGDDAATALLGSGWRMPTKEDFQNLYDACVNGSYDKTTYASATCGESTTISSKGVYWCGNYDGVAGCLFYDGTNRLFFPAAGCGINTSLLNAGSSGNYWSSSLYTGGTDLAYYLKFGSGDVYPQYYLSRFVGFPVRPVKAAE